MLSDVDCGFGWCAWCAIAGSVIHAEDATLYAQIDPEATVAHAEDLYADGAIDTNDNGMYAEVDMESENAVEDDNAVYVHLRNVYGICVFLACARVCAGECMAYELADARAWVRANAPA